MTHMCIHAWHAWTWDALIVCDFDGFVRTWTALWELWQKDHVLSALHCWKVVCTQPCSKSQNATCIKFISSPWQFVTRKHLQLGRPHGSPGRLVIFCIMFWYFLFMMLYCNVLMWSLIVQKFDECQRPWCKAGLRPLQACESSCMNACMPTCLAIYISFIFIYHAFLEVRCLHNGGRLRRNRRRGKNIKWMKKNQKQTVQNRAFHAWTNYYKKILFCFLICMHAWVCLLEALI